MSEEEKEKTPEVEEAGWSESTYCLPVKKPAGEDSWFPEWSHAEESHFSK